MIRVATLYLGPAAIASIPTTFYTATPAPNAAQITNNAPQAASEPRKWWYCDFCNETMYANNKSVHIQGQKHRSKLPGTVTSSTAAPNAKVDAPVLSDVDTIKKPDPPPKSTRPAAAEWRCDVCNRTMSIKAKHDHLLGQKHKRKLAVPSPTSVVAVTPAPSLKKSGPARSTPLDIRIKQNRTGSDQGLGIRHSSQQSHCTSRPSIRGPVQETAYYDSWGEFKYD